MSLMEIILLIFGVVIFIGSFLIPSGNKNSSEQDSGLSEEAIRELVGKEVEDAKTQISDIVDETITYAMEKTERSMDRLTNEKMLAVNEYSDTVLEEINKNHKEVVFMYDMLNDKHENLKTTVSEAVKTASQVKQSVLDAEITAKNSAKNTANNVESTAAIDRTIAIESATAIDVSKSVNATNSVDISKSMDTYQAKNNVSTESEAQSDFKPINPVRVEAIQPPIQKANQEAVSESTLDQVAPPKKSRSVKADKRDKNAPVPEVEITLNATGRTGGRNSNERILELHKAGKSNMAIAKALGLGIGEVKLVIDLFEGI